jgi:hypothetical protein
MFYSKDNIHAPRSIRNDGLPWRVQNHRWHVPYVRREQSPFYSAGPFQETMPCAEWYINGKRSGFDPTACKGDR